MAKPIEPKERALTEPVKDAGVRLGNLEERLRLSLKGRFGTPLRLAFTFVVPVLIVVNVPARLLAKPLAEQSWPLAGFAVFATVASLAASRWVFQRALASYRSASS